MNMQIRFRKVSHLLINILAWFNYNHQVQINKQVHRYLIFLHCKTNFMLIFVKCQNLKSLFMFSLPIENSLLRSMHYLGFYIFHLFLGLEDLGNIHKWRPTIIWTYLVPLFLTFIFPYFETFFELLTYLLPLTYYLRLSYP